MIIGAYAFSKESSLPEEYRKRYKELIEKEMHLKIKIETSKYGIGRNSYSGIILEGGESLNELDIALIIDRGNLCFGGSCTKLNGYFSCDIYTD